MVVAVVVGGGACSGWCGCGWWWVEEGGWEQGDFLGRSAAAEPGTRATVMSANSKYQSIATRATNGASHHAGASRPGRRATRLGLPREAYGSQGPVANTAHHAHARARAGRDASCAASAARRSAQSYVTRGDHFILGQIRRPLRAAPDRPRL